MRFKYMLQDAWAFDLLELKILDTMSDNLIIIDYRNDTRVDTYTISKKTLEDIQDALLDIIALKSKDLEFAPVLDGVLNRFEISLDQGDNSIIVSNLWALREMNNAINGKKLITVFDRVLDVLSEAGVDVSAVSLDYDA